MFDWQVGEGEELPPEPTRRPRAPLPRALWLALSLFVVGLALLGGRSLRSEFAARSDQMQRDLRAQIEREERSRAFGQVEAIPELVSTAASRRWLRAFERDFATARPGKLEIDRIELVDRGALATLRIDGVPATRYYRLEAEGWRRAELPAELWGEEQVIESAGLEIRFRERDRDFVERLAADLPELVATLEAWGGARPVRTLSVVPDEFSDAAIKRVTRGLHVISPALVAPEASLAGEDLVRLRIAERLMSELDPGLHGVLRNARQIKGAAQTVERLRWALDAATLERQLELRRDALDGGWSSPFLIQSPTARAAAELLADYLYVREGPVVLRTLLAELSSAASWDALLRERLGRSLYELELAANAYARGGVSEARRLEAERGIAPEFARRFESQVISGDGRELLLQLPGLVGETLALVDGVPLATPDGESLPAACAALFERVVVEGDWLEEGRMLEVESLEVTSADTARPTMHELPEPPIALAMEVDWGRKRGGTRVEVRAFFDGGEPRRWLEGFNLDPLSDELRIGDEQFLLLRQAAVGCDLGWLYLVSPRSGVVEQWRLGREEMQGWMVALSRPKRGDALLLLATPEGQFRYTSLAPGRSLDWRPGSDVDTSNNVVGWWEARERLVIYDWSRGRLQYLDLERQSIEDAPWELPNPFRQGALIDGGDALLYVAAGDGLTSGASRLFRLELESGRRELVWEVQRGEAIFDYPFDVLEGSEGTRVVLAVQRPGLAASTGRLLSIDLATGAAEQIFEGGVTTPVGPTVGCRDGGVLFMVFQPSDTIEDVTVASTELLLWRPRDGIHRLMTSSRALLPWSCGS